MATSSSIILIFVAVFFVYLPRLSYANDLRSCHFDQLYQLGDSHSDTGNCIRESPSGAASPFTRLPYGQTFFKKPTGRSSDGRLIIDFVASLSGLPFVNPSRNVDGDTRNGDNFATNGATALPVQFLASKNISSPVTSTSLDVQLDLMFTHFNSICLVDCKNWLKTALFMVGEIGMNDYNFALWQGKTTQQAKSLIPDVVLWIQKAIQRIIEYGAVKIVVPGSFPLGCLPAHLTKFPSNVPSSYDEFGCLKSLNALSQTHNIQLQNAIAEVQKEEPGVTIVYGDYYKSYVTLIGNAKQSRKNIPQACCGVGGKFYFNFHKMCGAQGVSVCSQPNTFINWDGIHFTEYAYEAIAQLLIDDILPKLKCNAT